MHDATARLRVQIETGPVIMGIVNCTPDSFSDGGRYLDSAAAIAHGRRLLAEGARILDIGGESTRPGATAVAPEEEQARILPVIAGLREAVERAGALISVDSRHAATMRAAVAAGAGIINDVTALTGDPDAMAAAVDTGVPVILMHMQGEPQTMQHDPAYEDVLTEVYDYLAERVEACLAAGIGRDRLVVDPGIGFGKNLAHNLTLLAMLGRFHALEVPVLLGVSRKRFISQIDGDCPADQRLPGSLSAALIGLAQRVQIFRVHDVAATRQAFAVWQAVTRGD